MYKEKYDRAKVVQMHREGMKNVDIAKVMRCNPQTVSRILKAERKVEQMSDFKNPEGYADPTAYRAINPDYMPGEVWEVNTLTPGVFNIMLFLQVFDNHAIVLLLWDDLQKIPEGCEEKVLIRPGAKFCDCSKPQVVFFSRLSRKVGEITLNRLIGIRQKVADIILRGYSDSKPVEPDLTRLEASQGDFSAEADKIPVETEKPQETPVNGFITDAGEMTRLRVKAEIMEQVAGRLFGILEKQAERG